MEILTFGNSNNKIIVLIHGFESPYQIWEPYIEHFSRDYFVIVPILPGHNVNSDEPFISFEKCAEEIEDFIINDYGSEVFAVYGMSMGGIVACMLWQNRRIKIDKLIMESSPLMSYGKVMKSIMTKQYLKLTHEAQKGNQRVISQAVNSMVTEDKLDCFLALLNNITDADIRNYISAIGEFKFPADIDTPNTEIYYFYGGKISEILFRKVGKFIKKHYENSSVNCFRGKGHCEDALINPEKMISCLGNILGNKYFSE